MKWRSKFRRKQKVFEAEQYRPGNFEQFFEFLRDHSLVWEYHTLHSTTRLFVHVECGLRMVTEGDWVVVGAQHWPLSPIEQTFILSDGAFRDDFEGIGGYSLKDKKRQW